MVEGTFWRNAQLLSTEIENASIIFHTWEELNRLALKDADVFNALNADALFWLTQRHSMQSALFMTLGRIFDSSESAISIHKIVRDVIANTALFSKEALKKRKEHTGLTAEQIDRAIEEAWIPTGPSALRSLKKELTKRAVLFNKIYLPIRHSV